MSGAEPGGFTDEATREHPALVLQEVDRNHAFATWRNVAIAGWFEETTPAAVMRFQGIVRRLRANQGASDPIGILQYVPPTAKPLGREPRAALQRLLALGRSHICSSTVVSPGTGFRAAAIRAVITGLAMVARPEFPHVAVATLEEAADLHARLLPTGTWASPEPRHIVAAVQQLIDQHDALY